MVIKGLFALPPLRLGVQEERVNTSGEVAKYAHVARNEQRRGARVGGVHVPHVLDRKKK